MTHFEEGTYRGILAEAGLNTADNDPNKVYLYQGFHISAKVEDGESHPLDTPMQRTVKYYLTDKAWSYSVQALQEMGFNGDFENLIFDEKLSREGINLVCTHKERDGNAYEEWRVAGLSGTRLRRPPTADVAQGFNKKLKGEPAPQAPCSDGIPF